MQGFYIKDGENLETQGILRLDDPSKGSLYDRLIL